MRRLRKPLLILMLLFAAVLLTLPAEAQCSICTRTAQQLGEKPARGLNAGILYLAFTPLIIIGVITYRFIRRERRAVAAENAA